MKQAETSLIPVHVIPKSPRDAIAGMVTDAAGKEWLKVRLTAAPKDGKANKALLKLLAKEWKCPPSSLLIVKGETSRHKYIRKV